MPQKYRILNLEPKENANAYNLYTFSLNPPCNRQIEILESSSLTPEPLTLKPYTTISKPTAPIPHPGQKIMFPELYSPNLKPSNPNHLCPFAT
jgi:hypothetical protein